MGSYIASNGYVVVMGMNGHPMANKRGWIYEHRLIASKMLGRMLTRHEPVHHKNLVKTDNRPENLHTCGSHHEHHMKHRSSGSRNRLPEEPNHETTCACGCGRPMTRFDNLGRPRVFILNHGGGTTHGKEDRRKQAVSLYIKLQNVCAVAARLGVSRSTVSRYLESSGVSIDRRFTARPKTDPQRGICNPRVTRTTHRSHKKEAWPIHSC